MARKRKLPSGVVLLCSACGLSPYRGLKRCECAGHPFGEAGTEYPPLEIISARDLAEAELLRAELEKAA